ncbi:MAG: hypothetical protein ABID61_04235 [Candidatus Micrarchaeota archaeon]
MDKLIIGELDPTSSCGNFCRHCGDSSKPNGIDMPLVDIRDLLSSNLFEISGAHDSNKFTLAGGVDPSKPFTNIIPIYGSASCLVGTFYDTDIDSINEAIIKKTPGPVVVVSPEFTYIFYKDIAQGKTIGEAFYASKIIDPQIKQEWIEHNYAMWLGSGNGLTLQASDNLLGDPSFTFYPKN